MFLILLRNSRPTMLSRPPSAPLLSIVCTLHQRARTPRRRQHPLLRQTSLSPRHLTVTYGEWYDFHDLSSLDVKISPMPPVYVCPVQSTSSLCMTVSTPSFLVLSKGPTGQFQAQPHLFSNGHRFFNCNVPLTRVAHSFKIFHPWLSTQI